MNKDTNIIKQLTIEEIITYAIQIPGVKVNRKQFLTEQFGSKINLDEIIDKGPIAAGIKREEINSLSKKLILARTSQSSIASFAAGIPGGLAMALSVPADTLQFLGMSLRLVQELLYLYGAQDLWNDIKANDKKVTNQLILYCGVMFGVSKAASGVRVLSTQLSKTALKKIPKKALTKTFWYPMLKKIGNLVGITITKKTFAQSVSKTVPVIGGLVSGGINFASLMPMANRLNNALDKATFNYSDEEFNKDIEIIMNQNLDEKEAKTSIKKKILNHPSKIISKEKKQSNLLKKKSQKAIKQ